VKVGYKMLTEEKKIKKALKNIILYALRENKPLLTSTNITSAKNQNLIIIPIKH
jgi:hypothetical protein